MNSDGFVYAHLNGLTSNHGYQLDMVGVRVMVIHDIWLLET